MSYVRKTDGCWEWVGYKERTGYGRFGIDGRAERAHRVSHLLHIGPIPEGQCVCHTCDNRGCVNPAHFFLGTRSDNIADMVRKGRQRGLRGELHKRAKLTEADVRLIRSLSETNAQTAKRFGVSRLTVWEIRTGRSWPHTQI